MRSNKYGIIGKAFLAEGKKIFDEYNECGHSSDYFISLDEMLDVLPHCHRHEELTYEALPPSKIDIGGECVPYSRLRSYDPLVRKKHPDILSDDEFPIGYFLLLEQITADNCLEGAWEYFLLSKITLFLPLFWHAAYGEQRFIMALDDYPEIAELDTHKKIEAKPHLGYMLPEKNRSSGWGKNAGYYEDSDLAIAFSIMDSPFLLPQLQYFDEKDIRIRYTYFNRWTGLYRETVRAKRLEDKFYFYPLDSEHITRFDCGITL